MNLSVNNVGSVGIASYSVNKNNNQPVTKDYEYDSYSPSFKQKFLTKKGSKSKPALFLLGLLTVLLASCNKTNEIHVPEPEVTCDCVPQDNTQFSRDLVDDILKEDTIGRDAYLSWYDRNIEIEVIDPDCCPVTEPKDPDWYGKCSIWISTYNLINSLQKDDTFGRTAYREWFFANVDEGLSGSSPTVSGDWNAKCWNWIINYLGGGKICEGE